MILMLATQHLGEWPVWVKNGHCGRSGTSGVAQTAADLLHCASRQSRARAVRSSVSFRLTDEGSLLGQPVKTSVQRY